MLTDERRAVLTADELVTWNACNPGRLLNQYDRMCRDMRAQIEATADARIQRDHAIKAAVMYLSVARCESAEWIAVRDKADYQLTLARGEGKETTP